MSDLFPFPPGELTREQWRQLMGPLSVRPEPPPMLVSDDDGVVLELEATVRVREQALYAAATMGPDPTPFPEEDDTSAERVVAMAKRFERYIRSGN